MSTTRRLSIAEWRAEGAKRFGEDSLNWRFVCPSCGHVASIKDWRDAGASEGAAAFSCVGRFTKDPPSDAFGGKKGPCNYAGGGLFRLNPVIVTVEDGKEIQVFEFAEQEVQGG